jgi:predicted deacetylase
MSPRSTGTSANRNAPPEPARRLIVSFHDLHPGSRAEAGRFLQLLAETGIERASFLVVPRWHGGAPFTRDTAFTTWLRELADRGHDLCLHGYTHRAESVTGGPLARLIGRRYTEGEGEFFQISRAEAERRVRDGLALLVGDAGLPVHGFTPPAWLLSAAGRDALQAAGLHYTTTWSTVELLQRGEVLAAPTLVYSCRNAWRRAVSRAWLRFWHACHRRTPLLRIAVHPGDFADARLVASLRRHLAVAAHGREAVTYRDLLPADVSPVASPVGAAA